jgi:hypothetical protein
MRDKRVKYSRFELNTRSIIESADHSFWVISFTSGVTKVDLIVHQKPSIAGHSDSQKWTLSTGAGESTMTHLRVTKLLHPNMVKYLLSHVINFHQNMTAESNNEYEHREAALPYSYNSPRRPVRNPKDDPDWDNEGRFLWFTIDKA